MAALGDFLFRGVSVWQRLAGSISSTRKFLRQTGTGTVSAAPAWDDVNDSDVVFTDITTGNVSSTKHGYAPKNPNDATKYLDGTGAYSIPTGSGGTVTHTGTLTSGQLLSGNGGADVVVGDLSGDVTTSGSTVTSISELAPSKIAGTAVINSDSRLSDSRTPLAHESTHLLVGSDPISGLDPTQIAGTAVITTDSRLIARNANPGASISIPAFYSLIVAKKYKVPANIKISLGADAILKVA